MAASAKKRAASTPKKALTKHQVARTVNRARIYRTALEVAQELPPYNGEYSEELGHAIAGIVVDGATLDNIATLPNMPPLKDLLRWVANAKHPFRKLYYDAKAALVPLYEERAQQAATQLLISKLRAKREFVAKDGRIVTLEEEREIDNVERSKLAVNTYQWTLSHLSPRKHGAKPEADADKPNEQLEALFASLRQGPAEEG